MLPTPQKGPKLSKEEYRRRFEEQVKANDELAEHYKQMQEQAEAAAYKQYYTVKYTIALVSGTLCCSNGLFTFTDPDSDSDPDWCS